MNDLWFQVLVFQKPRPLSINQLRGVCRDFREVIEKDDLWRVIFGSTWTRFILSHWVGFHAWYWDLTSSSSLNFSPFASASFYEFSYNGPNGPEGSEVKDFNVTVESGQDFQFRFSVRFPYFCEHSDHKHEHWKSHPLTFVEIHQAVSSEPGDDDYYSPKQMIHYNQIGMVSLIHLWRLVYQCWTSPPLSASDAEPRHFRVTWLEQSNKDVMGFEVSLDHQTLQLQISVRVCPRTHKPQLIYRLFELKPLWDPQLICYFGNHHFPLAIFRHHSLHPEHFHQWINDDQQPSLSFVWNLFDLHQRNFSPDVYCLPCQDEHDEESRVVWRTNQVTDLQVPLDLWLLSKQLREIITGELNLYLLTCPFAGVTPLLLCLSWDQTRSNTCFLSAGLFRLLSDYTLKSVTRTSPFAQSWSSFSQRPAIMTPVWLNHQELVILIFDHPPTSIRMFLITLDEP